MVRPVIPVWSELVCLSCATTTSGEFNSGKLRKQSMVAHAKRQGWLFKHDDCFCSQKCLTQFEKDSRL